MPDPQRPRRLRRWLLWLTLVFVVVVLCAVGWISFKVFFPPQREFAAAEMNQEPSYDRRILGTWQDDYQGKRTMRLREDGTGIMVVELEGLQAKLFASRLEFDMVWSLEGKRLTKRTVGGRPEKRVRAVLAMMGDEVEEEIIEISDQRLLVKEVESENQFDWRRVSDEAE